MKITKEQAKDMQLGFMSLDLGTLARRMEEISSGWNGKDDRFIVDGHIYTEDAVGCAEEIKQKCEELEILLKEMSEY